MQAELLKSYGTWRDVADAANTTVGRDAGDKEPSDQWKRRMLLAEHSPIRLMSFNIMLRGIMSWVSVHLVRHKFGIEHFVKSQRSDRTGVDRNELPQNALVDHRIAVNAQALINISRKRLCHKASKETRTAWMNTLSVLHTNSKEVYDACVPDCIYRGHCYEMKSCGFHKTDAYNEWLEEYRKGVNDGTPEVC